MPAKKISQREARSTRKQLAELRRQLQDQRSAWSAEYIGGTEISSVDVAAVPAVQSAVRTARILGHAVVVVQRDNLLRFIALPHPKDLSE